MDSEKDLKRRISDMFGFEDIEYQEKMEKLKTMRLIKTARGIDAINIAIREGLKPLFQQVHSSDNIRIKELVLMNTKTGEVSIAKHNYHGVIRATSENMKKIMGTSYYPYQFSPYAAYMLPHDLAKGEKVILDDLIEDIICKEHAWGTYRLDSAEATWDEEKFIIDDTERMKYLLNMTIG